LSINFVYEKIIVKIKIKIIILFLHHVITLSDNLQVGNVICLVDINYKIKKILFSNKTIQEASINVRFRLRYNEIFFYRCVYQQNGTNYKSIDLTERIMKYLYKFHQYQLRILKKMFRFFQGMDECGILMTNNDRRSTGSLQIIFTLHDSSVSTCFTNITPVNVFLFFELSLKNCQNLINNNGNIYLLEFLPIDEQIDQLLNIHIN
jgi:hypothetical protein